MQPPPPRYTDVPQSLVLLITLILVAIFLSIWSLIEKSGRHRQARYSEAVNPVDPSSGMPLNPLKPANDSAVPLSQQHRRNDPGRGDYD